MPLIPALGRQRQVDLCEFKASLVYRASSRTARAVTQRNPVSKNKRKKKKRKEKYSIFLIQKGKTLVMAIILLHG